MIPGSENRPISQIPKKAKELLKQKDFSKSIKVSKKLVSLEQKLRSMSKKYLKAQSIQTLFAQLTSFMKCIQFYQYQKQRRNYSTSFLDLIFPTNQPKIYYLWDNNVFGLGTTFLRPQWRLFVCAKDIINYISQEIQGFYFYINHKEIENFKKQVVARSLERAAERNRKEMEYNTLVTIFGGSLSSIFGCLPICLAIGYCSCAICLNSSQYLAAQCRFDSSFIKKQTQKLSSIFRDLANGKIPLSRAIQKMRFMKADKCLKSILQPLKEFVEELLRFDFCCEYEVKFDKQLAEKQTVVNLFFERAKESTNYEQIRQFFTQRNNFIKYCLSNQSIHHESNKIFFNFPAFLFGDLYYKEMSLFYQEPIKIKEAIKKLKKSENFVISRRKSLFEECQIVNNCYGNKQIKMVRIDFAWVYSLTKQLIVILTRQLIPLLIQAKAKLIIFGSHESLYQKLDGRSQQ